MILRWEFVYNGLPASFFGVDTFRVSLLLGDGIASGAEVFGD